MKKITFVITVFIIRFLFQTPVFANQTNVLVIQQIRGDENCCSNGSLDLINSYVNEKELSLLWAFRYDALLKESYWKPFQRQPENNGILLEITPQLASQSGVIYKGKLDGSDWHYAKNSMLVGYTQDERKKLIDTVMSRFNYIYGRYPSFTVAWMIDSWSLNYLHNTYGVILHEMTKEQYETDSYTLYGGIFNASYYPSKIHPLVPGKPSDYLDLLIVRQTISDLLENYGSTKAYFTSQPNDYLSNPEKKNISYFEKLLDQVVNQNSPNSLAVFGFENSYDWGTFGSEYKRQIQILKERKSKDIAVLTALDYKKKIEETHNVNPPFYLSVDFHENAKKGVLWFFSNQYRARLIIKDHKIFFDDFRVYAKNIDPYFTNPSLFDYSYWIIPYLFDGSLIHDGKSQQVLNDFNTSPFGVEINYSKIAVKDSDYGIKIELGEDNFINLESDRVTFSKKIKAKFSNPLTISIQDIVHKSDFDTKVTDHPKFSLVTGDNNKYLGWITNSQFTPIVQLLSDSQWYSFLPVSNLDVSNLSSILQPDRSDMSIDKNKSIYYWNNTKAVAGRNALRLYILPLNAYGKPVSIKNAQVKLVPEAKDIRVNLPEDYAFRVKPWFIDINSSSIYKGKLSVLIDGQEVVKKAEIEFSNDCIKDKLSCLTHPIWGIEYIYVRLDELVRNIKNKFQN